MLQLATSGADRMRGRVVCQKRSPCVLGAFANFFSDPAPAPES